MSGRPLQVLLVEDSADDAGMITNALADGGYAPEAVRVEGEQELRAAVSEGAFGLAVIDHNLPGFSASRALDLLSELAPGVPCLVVSGAVREEALGALSAVVERALAEGERLEESRAAEAAVARSGRMFEAVFENAGDAMLIVDDARNVVAANPAAAEMFSMTGAELEGLHGQALLPDELRRVGPRLWEAFLQAGSQHGEMDVRRPNGELVATEFTAAANFLPGRHIVVLRDIRARREAEAEAERRITQQAAVAGLGEHALGEANLDVLMEAAAECVADTLGAEIATVLELRAGERAFVIHAEVGTETRNAGARVPHGPPSSSQASFTVREERPVLVEDYAEEARFECAPTLRDLGVRSALSVAIPGNWHPFGVVAAASTRPRAFSTEDGAFLVAVANILAHALKRARSEEEMRARALHDSLTGLPNRTLFFDRLTLALARTKRTGTCVAVLFLDLDHFKALNDGLGHREADRLLTLVGARIERTMRESDTVARLGGDEFVVLCEDLSGQAEAEDLSRLLASAFDEEFALEDERHKLRASIGVALSDRDHLDGEALLRDADIAMYHSKESGRAQWTIATEEMRVAVIGRVETRRALERAIETDELVLHYQPIVALDTGAICAVEALVRWEDPQRGLVPPGQFIPLAEESELILRLGTWVLREACRQAARWRLEFGDAAPLPVHVNVSARQVADPDLPSQVREVLEDTGVVPGDIALEITESALIDTLGGPLASLAELHGTGIGIVLDDFGTGYSSLSYLERFPIDTLKIDRAFVSQLEHARSPAPIVTAIVGMARALGVGTVAEGVETAEQTAAVAALGCRQAQGYFFSRPAPPERIEELVRDDTPLLARAGEARELAIAVPELIRAGAEARVGASAAPLGAEGHRAAFLASLLAADAAEAERVIHSALSEQLGPDVIDAQIIAPAMIEIGQLWERRQVSVAQEHVATGIASRAAWLATENGLDRRRLRRPLPPRVALLANVDGEEHVLGLRMAADMLQSLRVDVRYLGSKVSGAELCAAAADVEPDLVGFSLTLPYLAPRLEKQIEAVREVCPETLVLLGGQGVPPGLAERTGARFVRDVEQLVEMASNGMLRVPA